MRSHSIVIMFGLMLAACSTVPPCPPAGLDLDGDCVADANDKCAQTPETKNQYKDEDGCPDNLPVPIEKNVVMRLQSVAFAPGTDSLNGFSQATLDPIAESMERFPYMQIEIACFASDTALAAQQAQAIKSYLVSRGVKSDRMQIAGYPIPNGPNPRTDPSLKRID